MNIDNLNKLIAHLEAQPPESFNMCYTTFKDHPCGTAACIAGHIGLIFNCDYHEAIRKLGPLGKIAPLFVPEGYFDEARGVRRYPLWRGLATLKRLRDTYLSTGQVVVDWGCEPGEEPKQVWTAPQVAEVINPGLPAELTSLLRNTVEA